MIDRIRAWWELRRVMRWCRQIGLLSTSPPLAALSDEDLSRHAAFCVEMYDLYGGKR